MNLEFTPDEEQFRHRLRRWLQENIPLSGLRGVDHNATPDRAVIEKSRAWQRSLYEAGYVALSWPREYGGQEMDPVRQAIVNEEMVRARAPGLVGGMGVSMLGPTLISWGSDE